MRLSALNLKLRVFETLPMEKPGFFLNADTLNVKILAVVALALTVMKKMMTVIAVFIDHENFGITPLKELRYDDGLRVAV